MVTSQSSSVAYSEFINGDKWLVNYFLLKKDDSNGSLHNLVKLSELVMERSEAIDPQKFRDWKFAYLGLENVESTTGFLINFEKRPGQKIRSRSKIFYGGDLLYGRLRPTLNKVFLTDNGFGGGICSTEFFVLKVDQSKIPAIVLRFILASDYVLNQIKTFTAGAALPRISIGDFLNINIPLPDKKVMKEFEEKIVQLSIELHKCREFYLNSSKLVADLFSSVYLTKGGDRLNGGSASEERDKCKLEGSLPG
jgi:hypothetical protein